MQICEHRPLLDQTCQLSGTFIKINRLRFERNINPAYEDATTTTRGVWQQQLVAAVVAYLERQQQQQQQQRQNSFFLFRQIFKARSMQAFHLVKVST